MNEQRRVNIIRDQANLYAQKLREAIFGSGEPKEKILLLDREFTDQIIDRTCERMGYNPAASNLRNHPWQRNKKFARKRGTSSEF